MFFQIKVDTLLSDITQLILSTLNLILTSQRLQVIIKSFLVLFILARSIIQLGIIVRNDTVERINRCVSVLQRLRFIASHRNKRINLILLVDDALLPTLAYLLQILFRLRHLRHTLIQFV